MLKIVNGAGLIVDLDPNQSITIEKAMQLFNEQESFYQDFSYEGLAPFTENNKLFFNYAHLIETPNPNYIFSVWVLQDEFGVKGNIKVRIASDGFAFTLQPNYAALNSLIKGIYITDIRTSETRVQTGDIVAIADLMLDTVKNPDKYPYIFVPVYNPGQSGDTARSNPNFKPWINYYNTATDKFEVGTRGGITFNGQTPFFKLGHILKELIEYLGYTPAGSFFTDPETKNILVETRISSVSLLIYPCMKYMPRILVKDFLAKLRNRLHLLIDFDASTGVATVETLGTIMKRNDPVDITPYVAGDVVEQELPEKQGYTVTLASSKQDAAFKVVVDGEETYPPLYQLTVGESDEPLELEVSTLTVIDDTTPAMSGARYVSADQSIINYAWWGTIPPDIASDADYGQKTVAGAYNNWPLRLFRYTGYKTLPNGKHFPCSEPLDLNADDLIYYRFRNDTKDVTIPCYFPPAVLGSLKNTDLICYRSPGLNYAKLVIKSIRYDLKDSNKLIPAKIYACPISFDTDTRAAIKPYQSVAPNTATPNVTGYINSYFDNGINGMEQVQLEIVATGAGAINKYLVDPITIPTNARGAGGETVRILVDDNYPTDMIKLTAQIRVRRGIPKYVDYLGTRTNFTRSGDGSYWYAAIDMFLKYEIIEPYWVVF